MMAADDGSEETGSAGTGVAGGGGPETAHFPFSTKPRLRVNDSAPGAAENLRHSPDTSPDTLSEILLCSVPGGDLPGSALSAAGSGSSGGHAAFGTSSGTGSGASLSPSEGLASRMSPTSGSPDGTSGFPQLPLPPLPPICGTLGTVDESDTLDGQEYEEEEVAFPLTAPPTNQ